MQIMVAFDQSFCQLDITSVFNRSCKCDFRVDWKLKIVFGYYSFCFTTCTKKAKVIV